MSHPPIFDGHNDALQTLYLPHKQGKDLLGENETGHLDLVRARRGGYAGGLFAIFVPSPGPGAPVEPGQAREVTEKGIEALLDLERRADGQVRVVKDAKSLGTALEEGVLAAVMHLEGAEAIDPGLERLEEYHARGLRSLGPVWSRPNHFGTGVDFRGGGHPDQGRGLTLEGHALVRACNRLGILVDLSHLNEKGFWDVARISSAPLVATHSCVHALSPSPRNLTDPQLEAIAASGGIVGINFATSFLRADNRTDPDTPMATLVAHFSYVAERVGVDHVGFGSDFDGCTVPLDLKNAAGLPGLMDALEEAGFRGEDLRKVAHGNWLRVLEATWA